MSEVKVNKISPRTNCGTVQLGDSGDTITIPAGATITNNGTAAGFGATGAASWDTTVKTTGFTAVSGVGYFVDTTSGAITVTLPASPDAGAVIAVKDYANTFDTNNVTLARNGSNIGGSAVDATLSTEGLAVTLVYVDATQGWLVTDNGTQDTAPTTQYVTATGGTVTTCGNFKIHTFTGPGTFCVSCAGNPSGSNTVDYLVVAAGAGGGADSGGGGGAGGFRESCGGASGCYTTSPLSNPCGALPVSIQGYPITVGAGGTGGSPPVEATPGANSIFSTITSAGGGKGGSRTPLVLPGGNGGSGGGGATDGGTGGSGNTPPTSPSQGNGGADSPTPPSNGAGGGGGAGAAGNSGTPYASTGTGGNGGSNVSTSISGSSVPFSGGGGGGSAPNGPGGNGGGAAGDATNSPNNPGSGATAGTTNRGEGGGGGDNNNFGVNGGNGGSGIVIIRYKFQ